MKAARWVGSSVDNWEQWMAVKLDENWAVWMADTKDDQTADVKDDSTEH